MARASGAIAVHGPPELSRALMDALRQPQRASERASERARERNSDDASAGLTHGLHTYPARMHPATAGALIGTVFGEALAREPACAFLDPFCGSGTTLVEARRAGLSAIGVDANPLAVAIARAKTWVQPDNRLKKMRQLGQKIADRALAAGKAARRSGYEAPPEREIPGVDAHVRNRRLHNWFAPHVRRELESLAGGIDGVRASDQELADVLTVLLSSILYKVSKRASDTDARRVERNIGRGAAARLFAERAGLLYRGLTDLRSVADGPAAVVHLGDARHLGGHGDGHGDVHLDGGQPGETPLIADASIDGVITSPPYAGTYEYATQQQLRLDFLGMPGDDFRAAELGARSHFQVGDGARRRRARRRYLRSLSAVFAQLARVARPGARMAVMLGDSVAGERAMWAEEVMARALPAEHLEILAWAGQERSKLGGRERDAFGDRPKREYIFLLRRRDDRSPDARRPADSSGLAGDVAGVEGGRVR